MLQAAGTAYALLQQSNNTALGVPMSETFAIQSTHSDRMLVFSGVEGDYFRVELTGGVNASIRVYGYAPHTHDLAHWFSELGKNSKPWEGDLSWESLEGEFKITAKYASFGQIHIMVSLSDLPGAYEEAYIRAGIETELGQLTIISNEARNFFAKSNT